MIRMGLCGKQLAGLAFAAGAGLDRPLAEQQRHQLLGQQPFADAGGTMQQVGMRMLGAPRQLPPKIDLPGKHVSHRGAPTAQGSAPRHRTEPH